MIPVTIRDRKRPKKSKSAPSWVCQCADCKLRRGVPFAVSAQLRRKAVNSAPAKPRVENPVAGRV